MTTLSRKIGLIIAGNIASWAVRQLGSSLNKIVKLYARGGFMVKVILMYQEFDKAEDEVGLVEINTTAARGHVVETKRMM